MFITFDAIPRTLKQCENMSKSWVGFPQAINQIGLKYEEVEKWLKEGKEPFDDEEAIKKVCEETLERLIEAKRLREAAKQALKEKDLGTAPNVASKPPLKRSYPMTTLEKLREKTKEQEK